MTEDKKRHMAGHSEDWIELADRVQAASCSDRELDRDIEIAIQNLNGRGYEDARDNITARKVLISHGAQPHNYEVVAFSGISLRTPLNYTGSWDAARSLIPEGMILRSYTADRLVPHTCEVSRGPGNGGWIGYSDYASELALASAALRALASAQASS